MEYNEKNILDLFNKKLSFSEIALELSSPDKTVTRGMVSAKVRRMRKKQPELFEQRRPNVHPSGKVNIKYSKTPNPKTGKLNDVTKSVAKLPPNRYTFRTRSAGYVSPSKAALYEMLRKAVENT